MMLNQSKTYAFDSRRVKKGDSFICLPNGEPFIVDALNRGAIDVINMSRRDFAAFSHQYFNHPTEHCVLIGVTGTNGKTSVVYFTVQLLKKLNKKPLSIGTLESELTTPESWDALSKMATHISQGGTHVVMEVSSHGIDQLRVDGFQFDIKCLTNISEDHLDYHGSFEAYKATKMGFMNANPGREVYSDSVDDIDPKYYPQLSGIFHKKNISTAVQICRALGIELSDILPLLSTIDAPPGRFESVDLNQPFSVIIDFAHTPDGLAFVLDAALAMVGGRKESLHVVFGCGGDRDQSKRSKMGKVGETYSHNLYITSDNSRSEQSDHIIQQIVDGITDPSVIKLTHPDRYASIQCALTSTHPGDVVIIAGKDHETMQHCSGFSYSFNDKQVCEQLLSNKQFFNQILIGNLMQ